MEKDQLRKLFEQKEAKETATKEQKLERESQSKKQLTDNIEKWEISVKEVILPLLDEYVAVGKEKGYKWDSSSNRPTTIVGIRRPTQAITKKITLKAPNAKQRAHSHQIKSPSMSFTPSPDFSAVNISVSPPGIGIPDTSIPVHSITKQSLEEKIDVFVNKILGDPLA
jgi:hypothetical protein